MPLDNIIRFFSLHCQIAEENKDEMKHLRENHRQLGDFKRIHDGTLAGRFYSILFI